ncbi:MAG TPA: hypothetical protein VG271_16920 [Beijerinckiaceae bacterium]|nr:hypothetical protein [Beijerinckiaceae bacterium]
MKILVTTAAALGLLAAPTFALAQSTSRMSTDTSPNAAPDSATSPMHTTKDKGAETRVNNNNGIYNGRSSSEAPRTGMDDTPSGTH